MDLSELSPQEQQQILEQREARKINAAGAYGPAPKVDAQQSTLLAQLGDLNKARLCAPYAPIRENLDAEALNGRFARRRKVRFGLCRPGHPPVSPHNAVVMPLNIIGAGGLNSRLRLAVARAAGIPAHAGISVKFSPSSKAKTSCRKSGSGPFSFLTRTLM
jgi:hypothetical protein